ncbi:biotin--[acetyl-CoA-carboxylase] ligase [Asticcacaulis sp. YBE204]|uniref:biotin--[acetyl-CoA-carboxylase] ligase n=1 Tax=Asticcacaulis sp. YBE204 TaxID=1282363 RepID=UPI0004CF8799|nr:biotin--[acetyl-CoA-carboxylase] ligase [Asticcacaulis sp. YBE204]
MASVIDIFDSLPSTQLEALSRLRAGLRDPGWVQARQQTAGVGRMGRSWAGISGNLMASWYGVLPVELRHVTQLSFVTALAVTDLLRPLVASPDSLKIKWPNDVLYDGRKLCGILVQTEALDEGLGIVIGIGINVTDAPDLEAYGTTALNVITREPHDAIDLLQHFDPLFTARLGSWQKDGFEATAQEWLSQAYGRDRICLINHENTPVEGTILGLDGFGALRIEDRHGHIHTVSSGSVTYTDTPCS